MYHYFLLKFLYGNHWSAPLLYFNLWARYGGHYTGFLCRILFMTFWLVELEAAQIIGSLEPSVWVETSAALKKKNYWRIEDKVVHRQFQTSFWLFIPAWWGMGESELYTRTCNRPYLLLLLLLWLESFHCANFFDSFPLFTSCQFPWCDACAAFGQREKPCFLYDRTLVDGAVWGDLCTHFITSVQCMLNASCVFVFARQVCASCICLFHPK